MSSLVFDRVVVVRAHVTERLTADQFFAMPLSERVRMLIERTARFYLGDVEVDRAAALASLRRSRARE